MLACGDLPRVCFSRDTLRDALRTFQWWQSVAEIDKLIRPVSLSLTRTLAGLRAIARQGAAAPSEGGSGPSLADEARDRILEAFPPKFAAAMAAARSPVEHARANIRPKPAYLSGEDLAGARREAGIPRCPDRRPAAKAAE